MSSSETPSNGVGDTCNRSTNKRPFIQCLGSFGPADHHQELTDEVYSDTTYLDLPSSLIMCQSGK